MSFKSPFPRGVYTFKAISNSEKEVSIFWQANERQILFGGRNGQLKSLTSGPTSCSTLSGCKSLVWKWSSPLGSQLTTPDLLKLSIRSFLFYAKVLHAARKPLEWCWGLETSCQSYCCTCHCKCIWANREHLIVHKFKSLLFFLWKIIIC